VRTLVDRYEPEGPGSVEWDGRDASGKYMATGVDFYRMRSAGVESSKKMLLLK